MSIRHEDTPHWFLMSPDGEVVDPTAGQFSTPVPYDQARGKGFLTKQPSKRARVVIGRIYDGKEDALHRRHKRQRRKADRLRHDDRMAMLAGLREELARGLRRLRKERRTFGA